MKVALCQINPRVGDFAGNARKVFDMGEAARRRGAEIAIFPELALMGYPPRDLVEHPRFVEACIRSLNDLARRMAVPAIVGFVARNESGEGKPLHNSAALICGGRIASVHHKSLLPAYDVFDEERYFEPGRMPVRATACGWRLAVTICEDIWRSVEGLRVRYRFDPLAVLMQAGADVIVNLSASPFTLGKMQARRDLLRGLAKQYRTPLIYVNQVGGNDELVFDGGSMVISASGEVVAQARSFEEDLLVVDLASLPQPISEVRESVPETAFRALVLGTRDYLHKCGFEKAVLGLSGGVDSALTACIAAEALGAENVTGVSMPSRFSSTHSIEDAEVLARNLGIRFLMVPIEPAHEALLRMLADVFRGLPADTTEENIQARIRGVILMALSNKFGWLTLATGNKSELATGYCTLYGDMCGGLAPIADVPKTLVYDMARWVNREREIIPARTLYKAPSAELRPNQTDQDTLPPYDLLDRVLHLYVEEQKDFDEVVAAGVERAVAADVIRRVETSEYKRRQAAPGLKITSRAFGYGRRVPIAKGPPLLD